MRYGSLFSGIAGLDRAVAQHFGATPAWHCEACEIALRLRADAPGISDAERGRTAEQIAIARTATAVLKMRFPGVPVIADVDSVTAFPVEVPDIICGGFPCQSVSVAGARRGSRDSRWLWPEMLRVVRELQPRIVVAENVRGLMLRDRGKLFGTVLADLIDASYAVRWQLLPASAVGAPHRRERVFILAQREGLERPGWPPFALRRVGGWGGNGGVDTTWPRAGHAQRGAAWERRGAAWPTICVSEGGTKRGSTMRGAGAQGGIGLGEAVRTWATATSRDGHGGYHLHTRGGRDLTTDVRAWATPSARDASGSGQRTTEAAHPGLSLTDMAVRGKTSYDRGGWPTPSRTEYGSNAGGANAGPERPSLATVAPRDGGALNATWVECLMGFPLGWTDPTREPEPWPGWPAGPGAEQHGHEPPRVVKRERGDGSRVRLALLGNSCVSAQAALALRLLSEEQ